MRPSASAFAVEDTRCSLDDVGFEAGGLDDRAVGGERAAQDRQPAGLVDRRGQGPEDLSVRVGRGDGGKILRHGAAGDGQHVAVQQAGVQQRPHYHWNAADPVDVGHHEPAERLDVGQVRNRGADPVEVVDRQRDAGLVGDRE